MIMETVAWVASALVFLALFMKTMIPLRTLAIVSNLAFIGYALMGLHYGIFDKVLPILVLHLSLLPLNIVRLQQMRQLIRTIREGSAEESAVEALIPYMTRKVFAEGEALFLKGETAGEIFFIQVGRVVIPELNKDLREGTMFGEVGIFTPEGRRSASAVCARRSVIYNIHRDDVIQLYDQNPKFGLFVVRLLSRYVTENVDAIVEFQTTLSHAQAVDARLMDSPAVPHAADCEIAARGAS